MYVCRTGKARVEALEMLSGHARQTSRPAFPTVPLVSVFFVMKAWARLLSRVVHPSALPGVFQSLVGQSYMESLERKAQVFVLPSICANARLPRTKPEASQASGDEGVTAHASPDPFPAWTRLRRTRPGN